jgi:DNA polymerase I-like protein with 3'-5' exonuclease and polymerase domains
MYVSNKEISKAKKYLKIAVEKDSLYITDFLEHYPEAKHYNELKPLLNLT